MFVLWLKNCVLQFFCYQSIACFFYGVINSSLLLVTPETIHNQQPKQSRCVINVLKKRTYVFVCPLFPSVYSSNLFPINCICKYKCCLERFIDKTADMFIVDCQHICKITNRIDRTCLKVKIERRHQGLTFKNGKFTR